MHDQDDQDDCTPESLVCFWYHLKIFNGFIRFKYASLLHMSHLLLKEIASKVSPATGGCCGSGSLLVSFTARHKAVGFTRI